MKYILVKWQRGTKFKNHIVVMTYKVDKKGHFHDRSAVMRAVPKEFETIQGATKWAKYNISSKKWFTRVLAFPANTLNLFPGKNDECHDF